MALRMEIDKFLPDLFAGFIGLSCIFIFHIFILASYLSKKENASLLFAYVPDLSFKYSCSSANNTASDNLVIDSFLRNTGFDVRDASMSALDPGPLKWAPQDIGGIDSQHRSIQFSQTLKDGIEHGVWLYSEPPTIHDTKLEQGLLTLVSKKLNCTITDVKVQTSPKNTKPLYDEIFRSNEWRYNRTAKPS
jgi:hypothetical protein